MEHNLAVQVLNTLRQQKFWKRQNLMMKLQLCYKSINRKESVNPE